MKLLQLACATAIAACILAIVAEEYLASAAAKQRAVLESSLVRLAISIASARQERDAVVHTLLTTERERDLMHGLASPISSGRRAEIAAWLQRWNTLRGSFASYPDQAIPEMQLLTELDWLAAARDADLDREIDLRVARARLREIAVTRFIGRLRTALQAYTKATNGMLPSAIAQLVPYFDPPIDPATLDRYEMIASGSMRTQGASYAIAERSAIDADFDNRHRIGATGGMSIGPWAMDSLHVAASAAGQAYAAANHGAQPKAEADLLPYIVEPIAKALLEASIEYVHDHGGQRSGELEDLRPYVKDPATLRLLDQQAQLRKNRDE